MNEHMGGRWREKRKMFWDGILVGSYRTQGNTSRILSLASGPIDRVAG